MHEVLIVGGGFAGLNAARALRGARARARVTLVDKRNFHLFQPLLYQVATGGLSPANIAAPLRTVLRGQKNAHVLMAEVTGFDVRERKLLLADGECSYDSLIVATGARNNYFGHEAWEPQAPGLKTLEDATEIRGRILGAFEAAERETDPSRIPSLLTFVVVGAGPTGVELAGTLGEVARYTLRKEFRAIDPAQARILLVEGHDRVLHTFAPKLSAAAERSLRRLGVEVLPEKQVTEIDEAGVQLTAQAGGEQQRIEARNVFWAAGVKASPLGAALAEATAAGLDRQGRVLVEPDLTLPGYPEIFVVGDLANLKDRKGEPLPSLAPVAIQQGRYAARTIRRRLAGRRALRAFRYRDYGTMATIGRRAAVADLGWIRLTGFVAWLAWLFIHLMQLVLFANRVLVFLQWAWNYFTFSRMARLITGRPRARSAKR